MKIKVIDKSYNEVMALKREKHKRPIKPSVFFRWLMKTVSLPDLSKTHFKYEKVGMEKLGKRERALYLMNHSSFIDLEIVAKILYPRPFNIVTTTDAFMGKNLLMRLIGCIPTKKYVYDSALLKDVSYASKELKSNIVIFPEAGYSFDGTANILPSSIGKLAKVLGIPIVIINTKGAFLRDPLYNNLQVRRVDVSATVEYLLSPEQIESMSVDEINGAVKEKFNFDAFRWQQENNIRIDEPTRADYLNRILYKCPNCKTEGRMQGKGTDIKCLECGQTHHLTEYGALSADGGAMRFTHIPDWYSWERGEVRREIEEGSYGFTVPVDILMSTGTKKLYRIGSGTLTHDMGGFHLISDDGTLDYTQKALTSFSLNADFNWYEIGDMIGIGNQDALFYCFPRCEGDIVAKARLATEEMYTILRDKARE